MSSTFQFGTVGSPISTPAKPGGSVGSIQQIASLGLGALELGWVQSVRVTEATCNAINKQAKKSNVVLSVHAPYFINLNASEEEWPKSRKRLMDAAHYGNLAGATDIVFHPGSYFGQDPKDVIKKAIQRLSECVEEIRAAGNPVIIRPETMGKSAMLGSLEDTLEMSKAIPGVLPCLDFAHLHARRGDGSLNSKVEWLEVLSGYTKFLGNESRSHLHIHLSGIEYSDKGERNHLTLAQSDFNLAGLFEALHEMDCSGRIMCESPILEEDALNMRSAWDGILGKPV
jgi:deoxyribonuclease-4